MTTQNEAFEAMLRHHQHLDDEVTRRVDALQVAVETKAAYEPFAADLVAYLAGEVLPHALAEEHTVYPAAGTSPALSESVAGMVAEHRWLASAVERLATAADGSLALIEAQAINSGFAAHVAKENELVLPALVADETLDLAGLLVEMHRLTEAAQNEPPLEVALTAPDTEAGLLGYLLDAAGTLADLGRGEQACRLVAQAWAALRVPRPDLAVRATAALHGLARSTTFEPVRFSSGPRADQDESGAALDVRALPPAQRHEQIFATYDNLAPGSNFVLVNDHDPKPLRYQFEAEHRGAFTWEHLEEGPLVWRVRIGRTRP